MPIIQARYQSGEPKASYNEEIDNCPTNMSFVRPAARKVQYCTFRLILDHPLEFSYFI